MVKIFILGRPGSGKSSAARRILKLAHRRGYSTLRINDYEILQQMFQNDTNHQFVSAQFGGFDVRDFSVLDTALKSIEKTVRRRRNSADFVIIEFARNNYENALAQFSKSFLQDSYFLFLDTDIHSCILRIYNRVKYSTTEDDHFVSEEIVKCYYNKQYIPANLAEKFGIGEHRVTLMSNKGSSNEFDRKIHRFFNCLYKREAHFLPFRRSLWNMLEKLGYVIHLRKTFTPHLLFRH